MGKMQLDIAHREVFTTGMIARICGVSSRTAKQWIDSGLMKSYRLPARGLMPAGTGDRRVTRAALVEFLKANGMPMNGLTGEPADGEGGEDGEVVEDPEAEDVHEHELGGEA